MLGRLWFGDLKHNEMTLVMPLFFTALC